MILHLTWIAMTILRFAGVAVLFAGVALFGVYFVGGNARSKDGSVPRSSWLGAGPRKGIRIFAAGLVMVLAAFALSLFMPDGTWPDVISFDQRPGGAHETIGQW